MAGMTWLHLSDWHQRGKDFDRDVVRDALIDDISKRKLINANLAHIDFIIFSGDVAFSGQAEEYEAAREYLFNPVLEATELNTDRLFVVPGNHDLDRNKFRFLSHDVMYPFDSYEKVKTWLTNDDNRNHLLQPFAAYKKFTLEFTGQDEPDYANIRGLVVDEKQVALLGCNSALMCGRHVEKKIVNDSGHLVIGEPQVYEPLRQIAKADVRIAVLHHPFEWLVDFDRDNVEDRLKRDCHFILLGHQHKPNVYMEQGLGGNCVIIPAGASYDRRVAPNPLYNNSYNFVHLDFETIKGTVYLRRWSERRKEWIRDEDTYELGKFEFSLPGSLKNLASSPPVTPIISTGTSHTVDADQERRKQQKTNVSPDPGVQKGQESSQVSLDEQPLAKVHRSIREAHDAVQRSKVIFEGRGDIQQIHYSQAAAALRLVALCTQNLQNILQTTSPFPAYLARERLIIDLRHINTEVKESIEYIANYGTLNARQRERNRKDTAARLSTTLTYLDDLNKRLTSKGPL